MTIEKFFISPELPFFEARYTKTSKSAFAPHLHKRFSIGAVVFVGDGKGSNALIPFWNKLKRTRKVKIEAVAIDMSPAYVKAVRDNLKDAVIVFDHLHIIKLFNEKLSNFRRQLFNAANNNAEQKLLKGTRWLLLTAQENLTKDSKEAEHLRRHPSIFQIKNIGSSRN